MKTILAALAGLMALAWAAPAAAAVVRVDATNAAATAALRAAACGDELQVGPGTITAWRPGPMAKDCSANPVVITAADPANPPVFAATVVPATATKSAAAPSAVTLDGWKGVVIRGVLCDVSGGGYVHVACFLGATLSSAITFEANTIRGRSDPSPNLKGEVELEGIGTGISGKFKDIAIRRNTFRDLAKGVVLLDVTGAAVEDNDMFDITADGVQFGGLVGFSIQRNLILKKTLPDASTAHPDGIQGLKGSRPSTDGVIADNLIRGGAAGKLTQGVFLDDDPLYDRIAIRRNLTLDATYRAISAAGLRIDVTDNTALTQRTVDFAGLYYKGASGDVTGNRVGKIVFGPTESNVAVGRSTAAELDAAEAAWMKRFRGIDARDVQIASLKDQVQALTDKLAAEQAAHAASLARIAAARVALDR
jgi:hypothetical protein